MLSSPVALVTGASKRLGRGIAEALHKEGYAVCLHYRHSAAEAGALAAALNAKRPNSAIALQADLSTSTATSVQHDGVVAPQPLLCRCASLLEACYVQWGRCDVLVNNASAYYPTPLLGKMTGSHDGEDAVQVEAAASDLFGSNAIAPYHLVKAFAQRVADTPAEQRGNRYAIVNMVDSMAHQPLLGFTMYTMAKYALEGLTRSAALELAPLHVRVNSVAPGLSLLPDGMPVDVQESHRRKVPLDQRESTTTEVGAAVLFLCSDKASYITGTCINVDGGWSLTRA